MTFDLVFKLLRLAVGICRGILSWLNVTETNQKMRDSGSAQAKAVVLGPGEVPPPPTGRVRVEGFGGLPDRFLGHTRVRTAQAPGQLTIFLPEVTTANHVVCSLFGYALVLGGAALAINACLPGSQAMFTASWVMAGMLAAGGYGLLFAESAICRINLCDDTVQLTRVVGIWFRRNSKQRHSGSLQFRGESQAPMEMARYQRSPCYDLTIARGWLHRKYLIACDTGVGDWVASVLQQWATSGRVPLMVTPRVAQQPLVGVTRNPRRDGSHDWPENA